MFYYLLWPIPLPKRKKEKRRNDKIFLDRDFDFLSRDPNSKFPLPKNGNPQNGYKIPMVVQTSSIKRKSNNIGAKKSASNVSLLFGEHGVMIVAGSGACVIKFLLRSRKWVFFFYYLVQCWCLPTPPCINKI